MTKWEEFFDLYSANFGRLTEMDGVNEWERFVENEVNDMATLKAGLQPYIDRYVTALDNNGDRLPPRPTLGQIKRAYYGQIDKRRQEQERREFGRVTTCRLCRGEWLLYVLAPLAGDSDRREWPADFRKTKWEEFTGIEIVECPICRPKYKKEIAMRIEHNSMPMTVSIDHPDFPKGWREYAGKQQQQKGPPTIKGDDAILSWLRENSKKAKKAANVKPEPVIEPEAVEEPGQGILGFDSLKALLNAK